MTETSPVVTMTNDKDITFGSCGVLLPNTEAKIVDLSSGDSLKAHEKGELWVRGPQNMKGYMDNPKATNHMITEDNWLKTGDIAYYDDQGMFYIVDRLKELIKVKGFQVPPAELEDLLRSHEKVQDVAVIGIPDDKLGQVPKAYIVSKTNDLTVEVLHAFVNPKVSEYKRIAGGFEFIPAIPKTASGKILRKDLVALNKK